MDRTVGVIGSGSFGITMAKLLAHNVSVFLYTRRNDVVDAINDQKHYFGVDIPDHITATSSLKHVASLCKVLVPVVPSSAFRSVMKEISPFVGPEHIIMHATKGLDISSITSEEFYAGEFNRKDVFSMSEVITDETTVLRVGAISGPNLAKEILAGQPAVTVLASEFDEVIRMGQRILSSNKFTVFGSYDLKGAELAGALKNIIAIGSGILGGLNMGKNMQAAIITRGLREMIQFGEAMGAESKSFLGTAGIGDLIATATSDNSRNYTFGKRLALGEQRAEILSTSNEVVEGVGTLNIVYHLANKEGIQLPITTMLYKVINEGYSIEKAIRILMTYNYARDVDFL